MASRCPVRATTIGVHEDMTTGTEGATTATTAEELNTATTPEVDEAAAAALASQQEEEAGFAAGFAGVTAPEEPDVGTSADPEPEPEPLFGGFTAAQLKEAVDAAKELQSIKKAQDRLNGTVGAFKQQIDQVRAQPVAKPTAFTPESFARLKVDYPDLAEMLAADMSGMTLGGQQSDPAEIERVTNERVTAALAEADQKNTAKFLTIMHPDWKEQIAKPEWQAYKAALPDDQREQLDNSWDAFEIGSHVRTFKDGQTAAAAKATTKANTLKKAVTPQGVPVQRGPATMSEEQAMNIGFKSVRGA